MRIMVPAAGHDFFDFDEYSRGRVFFRGAPADQELSGGGAHSGGCLNPRICYGINYQVST